MPSSADWAELADRMSTWTLDLSLPEEPVKWGHLSPKSCSMLVECVKQWHKEQHSSDGSSESVGVKSPTGSEVHDPGEDWCGACLCGDHGQCLRTFDSMGTQPPRPCLCPHVIDGQGAP